MTSAAGISQNDSSKSRDDTIDTSVAMEASVSHPTSDIESLSEGTGAPGSETLKRRQPVTVKRRPGNKNKKQQISEGPVQVTTTSSSGEVVLYYLSNVLYTNGIVLIAMYNYIV